MTTNRPPQVFHLITRFLNGGAERVVLSSVLGLEGYEFTVGYGASYEPHQVELLEKNGIETRRFPLIRHSNPVTALPAVVSVARYLRQNNFDIVHTHSTEAGIIGRFAAAIAGVPHVVHRVHGIPFTEDRNLLLNRFVLACERIAANYSDQIITNADVMAEEYLSLGIGTMEQYRTIYVGIDLEEFRNASLASDLPGNRPRITAVGRLAEGKGFEVLLDAAESICNKNMSLCLVGDGPLYDSLSEHIVERGLSDHVFLIGYRDDIPRVLAASDIFVLPSYREGTPRAIIEAMASGLPVVASDIAGIPEQVANGESGYLIPTADPDALINCLETLLSDPELRRRMGERGKKRAGQFSEDIMIEEVDNVYEELLGK